MKKKNFPSGAVRQMIASSQGAEPSGLEKITENGVYGWRLIGINPEYRANIGENAIDLSIGTSMATSEAPFGATGSGAVCFGQNTIASGLGSFAAGMVSKASGLRSVALGSSIASGAYSFAVQRGEASGSYAFCAGSSGNNEADHSKADGYASFVFQRVETGAGLKTSLADESAILGGKNNSNTADAVRSVILGGNEVQATQPDMVYVPGLKLAELATADLPATPEEGTMAYDSTVKKMKFWNGTAWETITSAVV